MKPSSTIPIQPAPIPEADNRRDLRIAAWLLLALLAFYLATGSARPPYGDESSILNITQSLLTRGALTEGEYQPGPNGEMILAQEHYSKYPLGQSLLELPGVALSQAFRAVPPLRSMALQLLPALECALMAALLFLMTRLPGGAGAGPLLTRRVATGLALATGVTTQLWPSASTHFGDTSSACLLFAAFYLVARFHRAGAGPWALIVAAWAAAMAYFCKNTYALTWPALGLFGMWAAWQRRKAGEPAPPPARLVRTAALIGLPLALAVGGQLWFNHLRYGSIWQSGYNVERDGSFGFGTPLWVGLYGVLFSSGRSLFLYSPLCLMAFFGWRRMARRRPAELLLAAGIAVPLIFTYARWWSWYGGWEWGNRFHLYLIPILMWIAAPAWGWLSRANWRRPVIQARAAALGLLIGAALFIQCLGVLIHPAAAWYVISWEMNELHKPLFQQGTWDTRDDLLLAHFAPEFSPVAVNAWLAWATWNRARLSEEELLRHAPSHSLNPTHPNLTPKRVEPYLGYDLWVWRDWTQPNGSKPLTLGILAALAVLGGLSMVRLLMLTRREGTGKAKTE